MNKQLLLLFLLFLPIVFVSCGSDDEPDYSTYTLNYNLGEESSLILVDLTLFEYNDAGEIVATNSISEIKNGTSRKFTANSRATKVKVYIKLYSSVSTVTPSYNWVQQVFYLENGRNVNIDITGSTMTGKYEP